MEHGRYPQIYIGTVSIGICHALLMRKNNMEREQDKETHTYYLVNDSPGRMASDDQDKVSKVSPEKILDDAIRAINRRKYGR
jgi:hypothetical protein